MTIVWAGHAAEAIEAGEPPSSLDPRTGWARDVDADWLAVDLIAARARRLGEAGEVYRRRYRIRAQRLLRHHWRAVHALASALSAQPTLDGPTATLRQPSRLQVAEALGLGGRRR
jgi:hypothetical protein